MMTDVKALVNYYAREGLFRNIQTVCNEMLKKRGSDATLLFWRAYGMMNEGASTDAMRILESIHRKRDAELARDEF